MRIHRRALVSAAALTAMIALGVSSSAQAASFSVSGTWEDRRGTVELPLPPGLGGVGPKNPVSGTIAQTGAAVPGGGPATISLPTGVIFDAPNPEGFLIPVPSVIQLTTSIGHAGPTTSATLMAGGGPGSLAVCPGMTVTSCTTVGTGGGQGTLNGIIKYTAGPNKFGGTLKVLLSGSGQLIRKGAALPPTVMTTMGATIPALPFEGLTFPLGGTAAAAGGLLGHVHRTRRPAENITHPLGYMTTPKGLISPGPVVGTNVASEQHRDGVQTHHWHDLRVRAVRRSGGRRESGEQGDVHRLRQAIGRR